MIRAVIFDCFGVLTTDSWGPFKKEHFGHDTRIMEEVSEKFRMVDAGLMDYDDFLAAIASVGDFTVEQARVQLDKNVADHELFQYIRSILKPSYKIGMLSNAGQNWLPQLFSQSELSLFDAIALSYETGVVKPHEPAYRNIAELLGVSPDECVFVDDQPGYCAAAKDVGMQAIWYQSFEQFKKDITPLLQKSRS